MFKNSCSKVTSYLFILQTATIFLIFKLIMSLPIPGLPQCSVQDLQQSISCLTFQSSSFYSLLGRLVSLHNKLLRVPSKLSMLFVISRSMNMLSFYLDVSTDRSFYNPPPTTTTTTTTSNWSNPKQSTKPTSLSLPQGNLQQPHPSLSSFSWQKKLFPFMEFRQQPATYNCIISFT